MMEALDVGETISSLCVETSLRVRPPFGEFLLERQRQFLRLGLEQVLQILPRRIPPGEFLPRR